MRFLILRILTHSELGMFHEYRRQGKEGSKQRAINFDWDVVDRVFPAAKDSDRIEMDLKYDTDARIAKKRHWLKRQDKNWRLEGNCPTDKCYGFVEPGSLFAMEVNAGTNPARGCWAVFPADGDISKAILADGESSKLAGSSMIALHDEEGDHMRQILADARPDLFTPPKKRVTMKASGRPKKAGVELPPNPARLVKILASVGHNLPSAIADLVDNSISADATRIDITFGRPDGGRGRWLTVADNGRGMDAKTLAEAMRIGSASDYENNALGKYGYGLKGASWSQAKLFTVVTKRDGKPANHLTWDVDDMSGWIAKSDPLDPIDAKATNIAGHGTVVLWKDMRPPESMPTARGLDPYSYEVTLLERHLALVFHRFLEGKAAGRKTVVISLNGKPVEPNNPVGHPLASAYDLKTVRIPTETGDGKVQVQAYLLPTEDEVTNHARGPEAARRALDLIGLHGKRNETQGLFIYRNDRLIKWGGWHQMWETNDEKTKLARVVVNFDNKLDDALKINISKQIVQLPQQLQAEIKKLADPVRRESQKKYRRDKPAMSPPQTADKGGAAGPKSQPYKPAPDKPVPEVQERPVPVRNIAVKSVKTGKFVWKVTKSITGALDLQVSDLNPSLAALAKQIDADPSAIAHLSAFLEGLDQVGVQQSLLAGKGT